VYSIKAVIWSLGISLFEIACFKHPFEDAKTFFGKIAAITTDPAPKLPSDRFSIELCSFIDLW
jgi:hypothetical protein